MIVEVFSKWEGKRHQWHAEAQLDWTVDKRVTLTIEDSRMDSISNRLFDVPAETLPVDVQIGDQFTVYFEKVKKA